MHLSGELARSLLEAAPDATVIVDADGKIVFANAQVEQTFGYLPSELVGLPVEILLPHRFRDVHPERRARFFTSPKPRPMGAGLALFGLHKNGREFPVEISLSPVLTENGVLVVGAVRDATAQKDTEHQLVEANRAKSRFLAAASHDLRQPLQTLNLLNRAAMYEAAGNKTLETILERQQRALDSMSGLLGSVLDISKLDSGAVVPRPAHCAVEDIFERLRTDFEPQALERDLDLEIECDREASFTDPELLRRLLGNLISNAIRYTNRGRVRVTCTADDSVLRIEVADTGIGIPPAELERIFEEFYQIDYGTQRPEGLGLGLSIVRRLADLLGYSLGVRSVPGQGTVFSVAVPRGEMPARERRKARRKAVPAGGSILIVDDEPAVAHATSLLLEIEGYEVRVASCEREAVEHALEQAPDLVVSDYHLRGGENGLAVVSAVRKALECDVPVVFVTGDTAKPTIERSKVKNAQLLTKPIRGEELLAVIERQIVSR